MHFECHAALGWVLANALGRTRRERNYVVIAAVLPDVDALPYLFGPYYYGLYHHTFGHNIFLGLALAVYGWRRFGWKIGLAGAVSFASHIVTDAYLSNWLLYLFWPFSSRGYLPASSQELSSPLNTWLVYSVPLVLGIVALIWKRTPLEWIHPRLDELFISYFQRKDLICGNCGRGANQRCEACHDPVCARHLQVARWQVRCPKCRQR